MLTQADIDAMKETLSNGVQVVSVPQLFPTPPHIVSLMIDYADIDLCHSVLEPSAGTGCIVEALINYGLAWQQIAIAEINPSLCLALSDKYRRVFPGDFLGRVSWELGGDFDRILMNPPFKNGDDIKHITHALTMLKSGGRLVAICANGSRQQAKLKPLSTHWEDLPPNTFKEQGTNVNTALLVIDKG